ncbi:hypothetical protein QQP08_005117 [Theobroma cacao]|nr:hypothetical protein QQP08_005117 [Theobroma cacao]
MELMNLKPSFARKLNQRGFSPIHLALQTKQEKMVDDLLSIDEDLVRVKGREEFRRFDSFGNQQPLDGRQASAADAKTKNHDLTFWGTISLTALLLQRVPCIPLLLMPLLSFGSLLSAFHERLIAYFYLVNYSNEILIVQGGWFQTKERARESLYLCGSRLLLAFASPGLRIQKIFRLFKGQYDADSVSFLRFLCQIVKGNVLSCFCVIVVLSMVALLLFPTLYKGVRGL